MSNISQINLNNTTYDVNDKRICPSNPTDGQILVYDGTNDEWVNANAASSGTVVLPLSTTNGGTGNSDGYIRTGQLSGSTIGTNATAEGYNTTASGDYSHAEGEGTIASGEYSHAGGKYNIADNNNTYAVVIGNGTNDDNRSNAMTLDWSGNLAVAGELHGKIPTDPTDTSNLNIWITT